MPVGLRLTQTQRRKNAGSHASFLSASLLRRFGGKASHQNSKFRIQNSEFKIKIQNFPSNRAAPLMAVADTCTA